MTTHNWKFVESKRTVKSTGKMAKKLTFWLCIGNRALRSTTDANVALKTEERLLESGHKIQYPWIADFFDEQLEKINSGLGDKFIYKISRMSQKDFNKWKAKGDKDEQSTF